MNEEKNNPHAPSFKNAWEKNQNSIWLATTLELHRNIDKFCFPQKLNTEKRQLVSQLILSLLKTSSTMSEMMVFQAHELPPSEREFLLEHFLIFETTHNGHNGQAYITEQSGKILLQINAQDHLNLHIVEPNGNLEEALSHLIEIEQAIEKGLPFAFSNQFGYVTANPCHAGTGLIVNAYLHIPLLIYKGDFYQKIETEHPEGLIFTSLQGNPYDLIGNLLVIRNHWTIGVSEEAILSSIRNTVLHVMMEEQSLRNNLKQEKDTSLLDQISRAIGTLQHSFSIDTTETLQCLSLVKLGIELNWITGISLENINELFFDCRRAHLAKKTQEDSYAAPQLFNVRATLLREVFSAVTLV